MLTKEELVHFVNDIKVLYEQGKIKAPCHFSGGNEEELIEIFKEYKEDDWIFSSHRSWYHWLLSGRLPAELKRQILNGHSMHIFGDRFFTSAIVSGVAPIALGVAEALKLKNSNSKVWCFLGDMSGSGGLVYECVQYAEGWDLPITYVIEDNCMSVRACTKDTWGIANSRNKVIKYQYKRKFPHAGTGAYVMF